MFGVYFTACFFPDGWGALGVLPEGSMAGGTLLSISGTGTLSSPGAWGGAASISINATATLTYTGEPVSPPSSGGMVISRSWREPDQRVQPVEMAGAARFTITARGTAGWTEIKAPVVPRQAVEPTVVTVEFVLPVVAYAAPVIVFTQVGMAGSAKFGVDSAAGASATGGLAGAASMAVDARAELSSTYDDAEEIALALLMLMEAA